MDRLSRPAFLSLILASFLVSVAGAQQVGGIRGTVYDREFEVPLPDVQVTVTETGQTTTTDDEGLFVIGEIVPGTYTVVFSKALFTRQFIADVVVTAGRMTELSATLPPEFYVAEEVIVQDLELGGTELGQLQMRWEAPSALSSISAEVMSQAGASTAADAVRLAAGATVEDGKYAVVRGLPDRYVNSQLNGVRLPTADVDKRAVQLDQFPAALVESIQISKTFTPDQQGDASGGAVNVILKGIPDDTVVTGKISAEYNSQVGTRDDFLTYDGGGTNFLGIDDSRDIPADGVFSDAIGTSRGDAPMIYSGSFTLGGRQELDNGIRVGALASVYYKHDATFYEDGIDDTYDTTLVDGRYTFVPYVREEFTDLYDVTRGVEEVKWGALAAVGAETDNHSLSLLYMRTQVTQDQATLLEDTRGNAYFADEDDVAALFHRSQTLEYTEREQQTVQFNGRHTIGVPEFGVGSLLAFLDPELDWTLSHSSAGLNSPDKRLFASQWQDERVYAGGAVVIPPTYSSYDPSGTGFGNAQRIWKNITEVSDQFFANGKLPFTQWSGEEGYLKLGFFNDSVGREYVEDTYTYDGESQYQADWSEFWSDVYLDSNPTIIESKQDVDYTGSQNIKAWYYMLDLPLNSQVKFIGGARHESTDLEITNHPESPNAQYLPPGGTGWTRFGPEADVSYSQDDILPSIGFEFTPIEQVKVRASYTETVARQTFKELSPVLQAEYLGADIFVGNPELRMSALKNYDLRVDYEPYRGGLLSASWFHKDISEPIEYVQAFQAALLYTTPINYPEGWLEGYEFELRHDMGQTWDWLSGFTLGANATLINSQVTLPKDEADAFAAIGVPVTHRDMTNAPAYLYNLNLSYESPEYGTRVGVFYTVRGDTLVEGGVAMGQSYVADVYEKAYGTLNVGVMHPLTDKSKLSFQLKNLTNPAIERVYRSDYIDGEAVKTSYHRGVDAVLSLEHDF